jgi:rRNA maturation endonuclease Nob1
MTSNNKNNNIEIIRTYAGYIRPEGRIKQTFTYMYRCKLCGVIKPEAKALTTHQCSPE